MIERSHATAKTQQLTSDGSATERVGANVRRLREVGAMSVEDFAQATGQSVDDAEALEAGLREVQVDELDLLADLFGVPHHAFFNKVDENS
jgi:transcriptional regulator with XRE-family HTH domain